MRDEDLHNNGNIKHSGGESEDPRLRGGKNPINVEKKVKYPTGYGLLLPILPGVKGLLSVCLPGSPSSGLSPLQRGGGHVSAAALVLHAQIRCEPALCSRCRDTNHHIKKPIILGA